MAQRRTQKTARRMPRPAPRLPGEKFVKETAREVNVRPRKLSAEQKTPIPEPAVDHRRQVLDDEPRSLGKRSK